MKVDTQQLSIALAQIQSQVIGLFNPRYCSANYYIPVIENNDGMLVCAEVGKLLALQTTHISAAEGRYIQFPKEYQYDTEGRQSAKQIQQTLTDMLADPMKFDKWYQTNILWDTNKRDQ